MSLCWIAFICFLVQLRVHMACRLHLGYPSVLEAKEQERQNGKVEKIELFHSIKKIPRNPKHMDSV